MRRDSIFRIASLTKPVTAVAALMLLEECVLRLDDPVDDLLPELTSPPRAHPPRRRPRRGRSRRALHHRPRSVGVHGRHGRRDGAARHLSHPTGDGRAAVGPGTTAAGRRPRARRVDAPVRVTAAHPSAGGPVDVQHRFRCARRADRPRRRSAARRLSAGAHLRAARDPRHRFPRASGSHRSTGHRLCP